MRAHVRTTYAVFWRTSVESGRTWQNLAEVDQAGRIRQNLVKRRFLPKHLELGRIYLSSVHRDMPTVTGLVLLHLEISFRAR